MLDPNIETKIAKRLVNQNKHHPRHEKLLHEHHARLRMIFEDNSDSEDDDQCDDSNEVNKNDFDAEERSHPDDHQEHQNEKDFD